MKSPNFLKSTVHKLQKVKLFEINFLMIRQQLQLGKRHWPSEFPEALLLGVNITRTVKILAPGSWRSSFLFLLPTLQLLMFFCRVTFWKCASAQHHQPLCFLSLSEQQDHLYSCMLAYAGRVLSVFCCIFTDVIPFNFHNNPLRKGWFFLFYRLREVKQIVQDHS